MLGRFCCKLQFESGKDLGHKQSCRGIFSKFTKPICGFGTNFRLAISKQSDIERQDICINGGLIEMFSDSCCTFRNGKSQPPRLLILESLFEGWKNVGCNLFRRFDQPCNGHTWLHRVHLNRVIFVLKQIFEKRKQKFANLLFWKVLGQLSHSLRRAPSHHGSIIFNKFREFVPRNFHFRRVQLGIDVRIEVTGCDSHRKLVSFVQTTDHVYILAQDIFLVQHLSNRSQRFYRFLLDNRVIWAGNNFEGFEKTDHVLGLGLLGWAKVVWNGSKLFREAHHEFWVAINFVYKFC